jgi:hypothetical protein
MERLNLGCGHFKEAGFVNVDRDGGVNPDVVHDLNALPYPFESDRFDEVRADHVLEHLQDPFGVMCEIWRIARVGARVTIRVPHFSRAMTHGDHRHGFDFSFPAYFSPGTQYSGGCRACPFALERMRLHWFGQPAWKRQVMPVAVFHVMRVLGTCIDWLANLSPPICSRLWCYWVGGFDEIEFVFVKAGGEP